MIPMLAMQTSPGWLWFDRIGTMLSYVALGTLIAAVYQWLQAAKRQARREERQRQLAAGHAVRPVALVIFPVDKPIESDVRTFLAGRFSGWSFPHLPAGSSDPDPSPRRWPLVEFEQEATLTADSVDHDLERLRRVEQWLKAEGYNEVHVFMRTTVAFGAAVGCLFTNWGDVHVYHPVRGGYEHWFALDEVKRTPALPTAGEAVVQVVGAGLRRMRGRVGEAVPSVEAAVAVPGGPAPEPDRA